MENILDYTLDELKRWMVLNKENEFRAKQVFDWIYKGVFQFDSMSNIPAGTRQKLINNFITGVPDCIHRYDSVYNDTSKFLMKYSDGNIVESVVMKYNHGNTVCISTQIGCRMGCKFCASTLEGMIRNLTSGEMIGEVLMAQRETGERISNVVLMGSGEPLDNFDNVMKFISGLNSSSGLNIGQRHVTLSTCGIVPKIKELADKELQITLAISLHAPKDTLRKTMMPIANRYSIEELMEACRYYIMKTNKRITFEYALVKEINDSNHEAIELSNLLKGMLCHVNLIPVNEVKENSFKKTTNKSILAFKNVLERNSIETTIRREMGADINAACGQLRRSYLSDNEKLKG
jgi:23S rRNA (adenine2503-C2)-methyltransferase